MNQLTSNLIFLTSCVRRCPPIVLFYVYYRQKKFLQHVRAKRYTLDINIIMIRNENQQQESRLIAVKIQWDLPEWTFVLNPLGC